MVRRDVKKVLMHFIRTEVREKTADWGELRRVKSQVILRKGLPTIPNLVLKTDAGLSFIGIIHWRKEIRTYLFDSEGSLLHGLSYYEDLENIYIDLKAKSKKIARYPPLKKPILQSQRDHQIDKQFKQIWVQLVQLFRIPQKRRKKRPLIKESKMIGKEIFDAKIENDFIHIPYEIDKKVMVYTFYSLLFFLPKNIRSNQTLSRAIAYKMLISLKQFQNELLPPECNFFKIFEELRSWKVRNPVKTIQALERISEYYDIVWNTKDFLELARLSYDVIDNSSRTKISKIFSDLYSITRNVDFIVLASFLGLPFGLKYTVSDQNSENPLITLFKRLQSYEISDTIDYLNQHKNSQKTGVLKAISEALNYQYSCLLKIEMDSIDEFKIKIVNRSDLLITLISVIQILPDGRELPSSFQEITIKPLSNLVFDIKKEVEYYKNPLRLEYIIIKSLTDPKKPIFKGTVVI
ncbi:MAG: hypothetical protein ACW964_08350 [Candidatus Hodarchaeales archaeon]|jgi:hypothetical protein